MSSTSVGKEGEPSGLEINDKEELIDVKEIPTSPEIGEDLAGYVEKVEKQTENPQQVVDNYTSQVLSGQNQTSNIPTLPLTKSQIVKGLHHHVWEGIRWLAEWCVRQIKVLHGRVRFKK
jgi:hypothetical protein